MVIKWLTSVEKSVSVYSPVSSLRGAPGIPEGCWLLYWTHLHLKYLQFLAHGRNMSKDSEFSVQQDSWNFGSYLGSGMFSLLIQMTINNRMAPEAVNDCDWALLLVYLKWGQALINHIPDPELNFSKKELLL